MITLARKYATQDEHLGFFMNGSFYNQPSGAEPAHAKEDDEFSYAPRAVPEAPVDMKEGEPLPEDRIVPFQPEDEAVVIDGV